MILTEIMGGSRDRTPPLGKFQVAVGFFRNTGRDPPQEAIRPLVQLLLDGGPYSQLRNMLKTKQQKQNTSGSHPLTDFSGSLHPRMEMSDIASLPSRQTTLKQRRIKVNAMSLCRIDVNVTSLRRIDVVSTSCAC